MITLSKVGQPFATEQAAKIQASRMGLEEYSIVPSGDGYAIETQEGIAVDNGAQETETASKVETMVTEEVESKSETVVSPKKHMVTTPWKPASYLNIPEHLKVKGRVYRWLKIDRPGNIDKKQAEGWTIDTELTKKMKRISVPTLMDGKGIDSTLQVREMVVAWMPEEIAQARRKYYSDKAVSAQKSAQNKYRKEAKDLAGEYGGGSYGDVKIS